MKDLSSLCLVCKGLNTLATQFLFRTIPIGPLSGDNYRRHWSWAKREKEQYKSEAHKWAESLALVRRLTAQPDRGINRVQTRAVREIQIVSMQYGWQYEDGDSDILSDDDGKCINNERGDEEPNRLVPKFEKELPGFCPPESAGSLDILTTPAFEALFRALGEHPNKPGIHLVDEAGERTIPGRLPGVVTVKTKVSPRYDTPEKPNTKVPDIQKLFFACPDLKKFSLSVANNYGGCMRPAMYNEIINSFQFPPDNNMKFPPLQSLVLSGYHMENEEWPHWRDGLDWSHLTALTLGPDPMYARGPAMADLLSRMEGHATALRTLTVETWASEGNETCPPLMSFLESFDTLEELTVKRHFIPVHKLARHRNLNRLCLHCIEVERTPGALRPTFSAEDLVVLDRICPGLETLEIDIPQAGLGEWPTKIIEALASSFSNLLHLKLHCEVGLDLDFTSHQRETFLPVLDEGLVWECAEPFFTSRGTSWLKKLTIKTGEKLRRFPQRHPGYRSLEKQSTRVFDVWMQVSDGKVKVAGCRSEEHSF